MQQDAFPFSLCLLITLYALFDVKYNLQILSFSRHLTLANRAVLSPQDFRYTCSFDHIEDNNMTFEYVFNELSKETKNSVKSLSITKMSQHENPRWPHFVSEVRNNSMTVLKRWQHKSVQMSAALGQRYRVGGTVPSPVRLVPLLQVSVPRNWRLQGNEEHHSNLQSPSPPCWKRLPPLWGGMQALVLFGKKLNPVRHISTRGF